MLIPPHAPHLKPTPVFNSAPLDSTSIHVRSAARIQTTLNRYSTQEYKVKKGKYSKRWPYMGSTVCFLQNRFPNMVQVSVCQNQITEPNQTGASLGTPEANSTHAGTQSVFQKKEGGLVEGSRSR